MDSCDPTTVLFTKVRSLEPEYATKIIGYLLLQDINERDMLRLALGPEALLQSWILQAKVDLGLSSNALPPPSSSPPPSPSLNPISRPPVNGRRVYGNGFPSPSGNSTWSLNCSSNPNPNGSSTGISPKSSPFLSFDSISSGSVSNSSVCRQNNDGPGVDGGVDAVGSVDLLDEQQLSDYLSFLDDSSSKGEEFVDPRAPFGYAVSNGDTHLHRRSFSASDACFGSEDGACGVGYKPCLYFSKGFCKNGDSCRFTHGGFADNADGNGGVVVGSPSKMESFYRQQEEMMRMKMAYQQRLAAAQFMSRVPQLPYDKRMDFLLHPQAQRMGASFFGDDRYWNSSPARLERNDPLGMGLVDQSNSASRQIYLTFPADSTFKDEDVANYFSIFGAVQDVRIPYQQKRMFGFVSFVHPETVKLVLARGNPHFICDSRVLVKPYKEKGKVLDKKQQQLLQQQMERGNFSPCSSPSGIDPREPCDFHLAGAKMFYDAQEMMIRRIEQADLQRAIELERRRFLNLQLPEMKNEFVHHHQRSISIGSPGYFSSFVSQTSALPTEDINQEAAEVNDDFQIAAATPTTTTVEPLHSEANLESINIDSSENKKERSFNKEKFDLEGGSSIQLVLPDNLFASTKSADIQKSDAAEEDKSVQISANNGDNPESPTTLSGFCRGCEATEVYVKKISREAYTRK